MCLHAPILHVLMYLSKSDEETFCFISTPFIPVFQKVLGDFFFVTVNYILNYNERIYRKTSGSVVLLHFLLPLIRLTKQEESLITFCILKGVASSWKSLSPNTENRRLTEWFDKYKHYVSDL